MNTNDLKLSFEEIDNLKWRALWSKVEFTNLMQSWDYGELKKLQGWQPKRFLLKDCNGFECGLLQVLVKSLPVFGGVARINRGPIMFDKQKSFDSINNVTSNIFMAIRELAFINRWWYVSISPELNNNMHNRNYLLSAGYGFKKKATPYGSMRLNLEPDTDDLLVNLRGKWRNLLKKGQKQNINIELVSDQSEIIKLIEIYDNFQKEKNFQGVSKNVLLKMLKLDKKDIGLSVYQTKSIKTKKTSGFIFVVSSGNVATYFIGWSNNEGRDQKSNYLLLWKGIIDAKESGIGWFDLGGLTKNTPDGIAHFKKGINGNYYSNIGEFYSFPKIL